MTTIEEFIDELALDTNPSGQVLLVNLNHTLYRKWVPVSDIKAVFNEVVNTLSIGGHSMPPPSDLAERLRSTFVSQGLWLHAPEPILERHLPKRQRVLTRITSYGGFFYSILKRSKGMPPIKGLPEPMEPDEIGASNIATVRKAINSGNWKKQVVDDEIKLSAHCVWLAPLPKLSRKEVGIKKNDIADFHRNVIGLSHLKKGHHLIRLDFDVGNWASAHTSLRRRPHGAGNGGTRFRLNYDGKEGSCNWGRTVDLARVIVKESGRLNGIPEMLMAGFSVPKIAITASYLGSIQDQPECEDAYFLSKLLKNDSMTDVVMNLKRVLT